MHRVCYDRMKKEMRRKCMEFFEDLLRLLDSKMTTPQPYGWFHLLWFAASILVGVVLCCTHKKGDDARVRRTVLITAIIVTVMEIYKQINYSFSYENGIEFYYQWYIFPWQFCSTPLFVGLIAGFTKKGLVHRATNAYLATYALFAGLCVMCYPTTVFTRTIGINIQTMFCHGSMITVAIYLLGSGYVKADKKTFLRAASVFAIAVGIAVLLNEIGYRTGLTNDHFFNMFYISPYCDPHLPVYSIVQQYVPFPFCLFIYIAGFSAAVAIILLAVKVIQVLVKKKVNV